eukprot:scaffold8828_cov204-Amphora_coffeaeformis.AAC.7
MTAPSKRPRRSELWCTRRSVKREYSVDRLTALDSRGRTGPHRKPAHTTIIQHSPFVAIYTKHAFDSIKC